MKGFKNVLNEIYITLNGLALFNILLNAGILFLFFYLLLALLNLPRLYSLIVIVPYLFIAISVETRKSRIRQVEEAYPVLDEKLRTARDNLASSNVLVDALKEEIVRNMKRVELSSFFNSRSLYLKAVVIMILCFFVVLSSPVVIKEVNFSAIVENITQNRPELNILRSGSQRYTQTAGASGEGVIVDEGQYSIYGDQGFALTGQEDLVLRLKPASSEVTVRDTAMASSTAFEDTYPTDITATASQTYEENIPADQQELVKRYFESIAKAGAVP